MAVQQNTFTLICKRQLTHDVYELVFQGSDQLTCIPGQYLLFVLPSGLRRSYSIAHQRDGKYTFIIKSLAQEGSGSREVCALTEGQEIQALGPIGHFVLSDGDIPRLFIGTWTWFAPLYYQIRALEERGFTAKTSFFFGVRSQEDMFYHTEFVRLSAEHTNFTFKQYLSQQVLPGTEKGYVTDHISKELIQEYQEFYICGSPAMVRWAREKLEALGVAKEAIRFEQY